jgi:hypothetical protein
MRQRILVINAPDLLASADLEVLEATGQAAMSRAS